MTTMNSCARLADFIPAYNFVRRLEMLGGPTPNEYIRKVWTSEPDRFILYPTHQMLGLNITGEKLVGALPGQDCLDVLARKPGGEERRDGTADEVNIRRLEVIDHVRQRLGEVV